MLKRTNGFVHISRHYNESMGIKLCENSHLYFARQTKNNLILEINWSDLHLSSFHGVVMSSPVLPVDTISM